VRSKVFWISLGLLAIVLWVGLVIFVNRKFPTAANQGIFLAIWGGAVSCTIIPLAYVLNMRLAPAWGRAAYLPRAVRQGVFVGVLATLLMGLRFMRILNLFTGILLTLLVVMVELLILLRHR
jgi:hypothetical protein